MSTNEIKLNKTNKLNKILMRVLFVIIGLLIIAIGVAVFYNPKPPELPEEFKQSVAAVVGENERFTVDKIELSSSGTIQVMLKLDAYPEADRFIELNVKKFIHEIEKKYNYDINISMIVYIPIEGTDKVNYLGRGSYFAGGYGKIEYEPAK